MTDYIIKKIKLKTATLKDGKLSEWSEWSECSANCGGGIQTRSRVCIKPSENIGKDCVGSLKEERDCNTLPCEHNSYLPNEFENVDFEDAGVNFEESNLVVYNHGNMIEEHNMDSEHNLKQN